MYLPRPLFNFKAVIETYDGTQPLHLFLGAYARKYRLGSGDRRSLQQLVYAFFRLGKCLPQLTIFERLAIALFLCVDKPDSYTQKVISDYSTLNITENVGIEEKLAVVINQYPEFNLPAIFSFSDLLSTEINNNSFLLSLLVQPLVWIRVQKKYLQNTINELNEASIIYYTTPESECCIGFEQGVKLQELKSFEQGFFEIQDFSSQQIAQYYKPKPHEQWWDCCAASGGKSLSLLDIESNLKLYASDIRENILENYQIRLKKAGYKPEKIFTANLANSSELLQFKQSFDAIIADVPCSGSGTWGRTPERISFFSVNEIVSYATLQFQIASNASKYLKTGGKLIYSTCSVFATENESVVNRLTTDSDLNLLEQHYIAGYGRRSDTLFVAVLQKN